MAEPLSTIASILAVLGFAAESSKIILKICRGVSSMPNDVCQSLQSLQSLHEIMANLQKTGANLGSSRNFPAHLCARLGEYLEDLKQFEAKLNRIHTKIGKKAHKHEWEEKVIMSWQRIRWALKGEEEIRRFFEKMKLYHIEFSMALLTLLLCVDLWVTRA